MLLSAQTGKTRMKSPFKLQDVPVSDSDVSIYERDGVVCLRGAFSDDWIEQGRRAIAAVIRTRSYSDQHATHQKRENRAISSSTPFCGNGFLHFENLHLNHLLLHLPKR